MTIELYHNLTVYGDFYSTTHKLKKPKEFVDWTEDNFSYVRYNPRKDIRRYGLSITSYDGNMSGIPDLDSLPEYNKEMNTNLHETDFNVPTPVYDYPDLCEVLNPIKHNICRTHVLKLDPGGYFPPHRDFRKDIFSTFRLIIPLKNVNPPSLTFILDGKILNWELGNVYFVNTAKMHYLFNASSDPSYMIIINTILNKNSIDYVTYHLQHH
jgi:hypothetical protein